ncbi:hypothetical protein SAMN05443247_06434 [Bradyrhizobium erythrophlei]|nr:hypothetical protein SAMN05443247_06434 [Bradyrhizobium erythrophlei]
MPQRYHDGVPTAFGPKIFLCQPLPTAMPTRLPTASNRFQPPVFQPPHTPLRLEAGFPTLRWRYGCENPLDRLSGILEDLNFGTARNYGSRPQLDLPQRTRAAIAVCLARCAVAADSGCGRPRPNPPRMAQRCFFHLRNGFRRPSRPSLALAVIRRPQLDLPQRTRAAIAVCLARCAVAADSGCGRPRPNPPRMAQRCFFHLRNGFRRPSRPSLALAVIRFASIVLNFAGISFLSCCSMF